MASFQLASPRGLWEQGPSWQLKNLQGAGIIIGGIVIILALKFLTRWIEVKREWQAERARLQAMQMQAAAGAPIQPANGAAAYDVAPAPPYGGRVVELGAVDRFLDDILREKPARFTPEDLRGFTRNYAERLGSGSFGVVYRGAFPNGAQVAVKILNSTLDRRAEEQFMAEVGTAGRTYHINLVRLYGFCFDATTKALVYEYLENGSLDRALFEHEQRRGLGLGFDTLYGVVVGTARGLWLPLPVTHKCDVYSFGMLVFEILGRRRNLELQHPAVSQEWYPKWVWQRFDQGRFDDVMAASGIHAKDRDKAERMCKVALWCVQYQPEARPSMSSVVRMLEGEEEIARPVNPFTYIASLHTTSSSSSGGSAAASGGSSKEFRCMRGAH
ncbi:hypothetical protein C2845_PM16G22510 [Panicum miliaceum]|uniref:Protein kinase domain-containing protein n=1 Tax=Panicum miliaceum TaxID=4540 RepID=A0A3L6PSA3_PANMI|nr:hypothetical protein C2845_PM16G22510 [Panicum miliaceum]